METLYRKNPRRGWEGKTLAPLGSSGKDGPRELEISTWKNGKILMTTATVHQRYGSGVVHMMGFGGPGGDYSKTIHREILRCTEANVKAQHEAMLIHHFDIILAEAKAHYPEPVSA
jgi:hypothetical protein